MLRSIPPARPVTVTATDDETTSCSYELFFLVPDALTALLRLDMHAKDLPSNGLD